MNVDAWWESASETERKDARLQVARNEVLESIEEDWESFVRLLFWDYFTDGRGYPLPFAEFHKELWCWVWSIRGGEPNQPFIGIWPRDTGKSTSAELAVPVLGARNARKYVLYVCGTQDQADDHVGNIAGMLGSPTLEQMNRALTQRSLNKYGQSQGWRRNRLRTGSGLIVDALGLNVASRGIKIDADRPDLIILDDVDCETDTLRMVAKKAKVISRKILPTIATHGTVLAVQNLIHPDSIFARLEDGRADFLKKRTISGPFPAIRELKYQEIDGGAKIVSGEPTWEGLSLEKCQHLIDTIGLSAFLVEHQQERMLKEGGILSDLLNMSVHLVEIGLIPLGWTIRRCFDWGSSRPFAVLWVATSDGESPILINGKHRVLPKGSRLVLDEIYGWNGRPNEGLKLSDSEIARKIRNVEEEVAWGKYVKPGPADTQIFQVSNNGDSIAKSFQRVGVRFIPAVKGPGSRINRAQIVRSMVAEALKERPEEPVMLFSVDCDQTWRTFQLLQRDDMKPEDVDTDGEDHLWDALGYEVITPHRRQAGAL